MGKNQLIDLWIRFKDWIKKKKKETSDTESAEQKLETIQLTGENTQTKTTRGEEENKKESAEVEIAKNEEGQENKIKAAEGKQTENNSEKDKEKILVSAAEILIKKE